MEDTNPSGSEPLNVNTAASAFLGLMGDDGESDDGQLAAESETEETDVAEASDDSEVEYAEDDEGVEEADDAEPEPQRFKVKAAGEEIEVELDELISGYQRSKDYTQKSQALAEQRKEVEARQAQLAEVQKEREVYAQRLKAVDQFLAQQASDFSEQDLAVLKETDPIGYAVKVAERTELEKKRAVINAEQQRLAETWVQPGTPEAEQIADKLGSKLAHEYSLMALLKRPELDYQDVKNLKGEGSEDEEVAEQVVTQAKYEGYINRQMDEIERLRRHEMTRLPEDFVYDDIPGLSNEVKQKLNDLRPETLAAASRIPGVTPAAVSLLLIQLKKRDAVLVKTA